MKKIFMVLIPIEDIKQNVVRISNTFYQENCRTALNSISRKYDVISQLIRALQQCDYTTVIIEEQTMYIKGD